jgi:prephenate dehydrogenase
MWRDICIANRRALLAVIDRFSGDLLNIRSAVENGDGESLKTIFARAKQTRDRYVVK